MSRFHLLSVEDLLTRPDPRALIAGLLPEDGLVGLFGATGSVKSGVALDWSLCVASGLSWFDHTIEGPSYVVYVAAEGAAGLKARVRAWSVAHGSPDLSRVRFLPEGVNMLERREVEEAREVVEALPEAPKLFVVDTMARSMPGGDENSSRDVGLLVRAVDGLRKGGCGLIVHHSGHDPEHERGSTALRAAVDVMAKVEREGQRVTLSCVKARDTAPFEPAALRIEPTGDSFTLSLAVPPADAAERKAEIEEQILDYVRASEPATKRAIRQAIKGRNGDKDAALDALEQKGLVNRSREGFRACPDPPGTLGHASAEASKGGVPLDGPPSPFGEGSSGHATSLDVPSSNGRRPQVPDPAVLDAAARSMTRMPEEEAEALWQRLDAICRSAA